ncbi:MAG: 5-(carboxyamino)imidazole ribonucleotide mutase [Dehalococcoidia bacterium]
MPQVGIIVGSMSDQPVMEDTVKTLESLGIEGELVAASAHRDPDRVREYVLAAPGRGVEVFIAAAGGAAALPGVVASFTTLPVIGVPLASSELKGVDALHSIVQMPPGVPVATVAVGAWGARNAALLAAEILGIKYAKIRQAVEEYRQRLRQR